LINIGLVTGFGIWLYALFLPSFGPEGLVSAQVLGEGPWGLGWLRPHALFGIDGVDPLLHALIWSLLLNAAVFIAGSLASFPGPIERMQGLGFVSVFEQHRPATGWSRGTPETEDLLALAQGILGAEGAQEFFQAGALAQGKAGFLPDPTPRFLESLERRLAGAVGAATAHAMMARIAEGASVSVQDLMAVASEAQQILEYSTRLEAQSDELARTASALAEANEKLTELSVQKDAFLSQISHELRTPMTSIRSFSEILMEPGLDPADQARYAEIIHDETARLTRLLDDLLDLSVLENRTAQLRISAANLHDLIERAVQVAGSTRPERRFLITRDLDSEHVAIFTDTDRLVQVLINLMSNARKYCDAARPELRIQVRARGTRVTVDVIDNGSGIPRRSQAIVFEKFVRLSDTARAGGAGLGLAICREIMENLGGTIVYLPGQGGAAFRLSLPLRRTLTAAA
jgi:signal transduction histidine kinase